MFLVPGAKLLVTVPASADRLVLHRFDLDALLEKSGTDYLLATGQPAAVAAGSKFSFAPVVRSKKGGAKLRLTAGPAGMVVGPTGAVEWDVPAKAAGTTEVVTVAVSDASGQEVSHTFKLTITPADPGAGPAPDEKPTDRRK